MNRKFGALTSTQDPNQLATRVKGIVLSLSAVIIFVAAQFFHIQLSANDIVTLATELGAVSGAVVTIYGFGLAIVSHFAKQPA